MARFLGIDYGTKRIGIALSDPDARIVSPARVMEAKGSPAADAEAVIALAADLGVDAFVVGLPLNMDGTESEQTRLTRAFARELESRRAGAVHLWDERLSSHAADGLLAERDLTRKRRAARRDAIAAAVILSGFLEAQRRPG